MLSNAITSPGQNTPLVFPRDHHLRRRLGWSEETFEHHAKCNLNWLAWLLNEYTDPGAIVLDPMAGVGSTLLAALNQHPTLAGDVEPYWASLLNQNRRRILERHLIVSPILTCRWTATRLPLPDFSIPAIVTSPPYFDLFSNWNRKQGSKMDGRHVGPNGLSYGDHPEQIGNLHIYEDYLRRMRQVYLEAWRILRPGGNLVLIIGDKVREARVVPVTDDTLILALANNFRLVATRERQTVPSRWRNIHNQWRENYPLIIGETALILQKPADPARQPKHLFIIEAPTGASSPGQTLFHKQLTYYLQQAIDQTGPIHYKLLILDSDGLSLATLVDRSNVVWTGDHPPARQRRDWCYRIVGNLVANHGIGAGDEIELHVTDRYARYLQQRLTTIGAVATIPTAHHNFGQKLAWYTERSRPGQRAAAEDRDNRYPCGERHGRRDMKQYFECRNCGQVVQGFEAALCVECCDEPDYVATDGPEAKEADGSAEAERIRTLMKARLEQMVPQRAKLAPISLD